MKYLFVFLAGAAAGALAALLMAPKSGDELRATIHDEAIRDQERIRQSYESARQTAQEKYEQVQTKLQKEAEEASDELADALAEVEMVEEETTGTE